MKKILLLLIITGNAVYITNCQTTFNLRDRYGFEACTLASIIPTDSCYYVTGIIADTIFPYKTGTIFVKLDLEGNPLLIKTLKSVGKTYETWYNSLTLLDDGNLFVTGYSIDSMLKTILIKYNVNGDTLFVKEFQSPYFPSNDFIVPRGGSVVLQDGGVAILNYLGKGVGNYTDADFYIIRTDSSGTILWDKIYATPLWERPESLKATPDGKMIAGGILTNQGTNVQNYTFQCHIFQVDTLGKKEWSYTSPLSSGLRDAANDMLLLDDGSIIVASGIGHEQYHPSVSEVYFDRYVFKLNPQHEIEWELTFADPTITLLTGTSNLVGLSDGSGYILAGRVHSAPEQPSGYSATKGWLAKISPDGDSIWTRSYSYPMAPPSRHIVYDLKETPDGGLILCGQSRDWNNYPQQGWLLKLDQHGCLVPGCHLSDVVEEEAVDERIHLSIYPNPARDYLNFYLRTPSPVREASFRIINAAGVMVSKFKSDMPDVTYIVPVWDWPSGVYFLQYLEEGQVRTSQKFIKH